MTTRVWKTKETEYYTRILKRPNRHGNVEAACRRTVTYWNARLADGKVVQGLTTRRDALAALTGGNASICHREE